MRRNAPVQFGKGATEKGWEQYLAGALLHSKAGGMMATSPCYSTFMPDCECLGREKALLVLKSDLSSSYSYSRTKPGAWLECPFLINWERSNLYGDKRG